ncbi:MAG: AmmeMemoRadiSam system protein A [Spirochaetia bacterium]|nr:AmmeMemoRadiSam system protein A [Spirochaetia bacterium]
MNIELSAQDRENLIAIARETLSAKLEHRSPAYPEHSWALDQRYGLFVTIKTDGQLRGCIGRMSSNQPIFDTIKDMALAAGFEDPRFAPLTRAELPLVDIEITILGPLEILSPPDNFELGVHGLFIASRGRSGVLLPQVAVEYGWNKTEFLQHVCIKAGLPPETWKSPETVLYRFEGIVF